MKKKIMIFLLAILTFSSLWKEVRSQINPKDDPNFVKVDSKSDEFNGTSIQTSKWEVGTPTSWAGWGYGSIKYSSNVIVSDGYLKLRWIYATPYMKVGQIRSINSDYTYGYFEISAKMLDPGNYKNGIPCATGLWPSFWLYYEDWANVHCYTDEIDIVETLYKTCGDVNVISSGVHDSDPESTNPNFTDCENSVKIFDNKYTHSQPLFNSEHIYAVEWLPNKVIYYFDDESIVTYDGAGVPQHSMRVVLSMQTNNSWVDFDETISSPQDFKVNYFRYYRLIDDYCGTDAIIQNNFHLNSFNYGVRRNITIDGSSPISLSSGDRKVFRASNKITITSDFTVPIGSELYLIPTACN